MTNLPLRENMIFSLRTLFDQFGYSRYKMNKFEEYDLYARNKDFLISDGVITFTDTNGRLMALKPDVTLSIVKNTRDKAGSIRKLYYDENVYRVSKGTHNFKELMQVGLEAIGSIDDYCIYEVLKLAAESLSCTGRNCILEISHLGLLTDVLESAGVPEDGKAAVLRCIGEKNLHELSTLCRSLGILPEHTERLKAIASIYGTPDEVLPQLDALLSGLVCQENLRSFTRILSSLNACKRSAMFRIDFSAVSDLRYYNGFVFRGFAEGIPNSILSGGQYDTLMRRMKRQDGAIGFAVYLDLLEQYSPIRDDYDVDILLLYGDTDSIEEIEARAKQLGADGSSILVQRQVPPGLRYRQLETIGKGR